MRVLAWAVALGLTVMFTGVSHAGPAQDLNDARALVRGGKYKAAIPKLNYLLYPRARLAARADLIEAHVLLGVSYFESGDTTSAEPEFEKALFLDRSLTLDELLFSKKAIKFFDEKKRKMDDQRRKDERERRLAAQNAALKQLLKTAYTVEKNSRFVSFIPFGVGQFQNDHTNKGYLFFTSQIATGGLSLGIWTWQVLKYGFDGSVPINEAGTVRRLQQIQVASGAAFLVLMVWGILDAQRHFQQSKLTRGIDKSLIEQLRKMNDPSEGDSSDEEPKQPTKPKPKKSSFKLLPTATPNGGGLVMSWEF